MTRARRVEMLEGVCASLAIAELDQQIGILRDVIALEPLDAAVGGPMPRLEVGDVLGVPHSRGDGQFIRVDAPEAFQGWAQAGWVLRGDRVIWRRS